MTTHEKKRGHWPAGKRRHQPLPQRQINGLMRRIGKLVSRQPRNQHSEGVSINDVACEVGVSDRTVRRWLDGEDNPSPDNLVKLQAWLDAHQA